MNIVIREIRESDFEVLLALFMEFAVFEMLPKKMTNSISQMKIEKDSCCYYRF